MEEIKEEKKEEAKSFTQEQVNEIVKERLERERAKYSDYEDLKKQVESFNDIKNDYENKLATYSNSQEEINGLKARIKQYEMDSVKTSVCYDLGIPVEFASRLNGETEEEIKADALKIKGLFPNSGAPMRNQESEPTMGGVTKAFLELNKGKNFKF